MQEYQMLAPGGAAEYAKLKQACASVKTQYINWVQQETDKKTQASRAITEAIVTGVGYLETDHLPAAASQIVMPRSPTSRGGTWCSTPMRRLLGRRAVDRHSPRAAGEPDRAPLRIEEGELQGQLQSFELPDLAGPQGGQGEPQRARVLT
jgi:hypothetical protein